MQTDSSNGQKDKKLQENSIKNEDTALFFQVNSLNSLSFIYDFKPIYHLFRRVSNEQRHFPNRNLQNFFSKILLPSNEESGIFNTNMNIVKTYLKTCKKQSKFEANNAIEYFLDFETNDNVENLEFELNIDNIEHLGQLLIYSFQKMEAFKINTEQKFHEALKGVSLSKTDVIKDYQNYYDSAIKIQGNKVLDRINYWKLNRNKYLVPPELLFILKFCKKYSFIKFSLLHFNQEQFYFILIIIFNTELIFQKFEGYYIDFSLKDYLKNIYEIFQHFLNEEEKKTGKFVKKYNFKDLDFQHHWNFDFDYLLKEENVDPFYENEATTFISSCLTITRETLSALNSIDSFNTRESINPFAPRPFEIVNKGNHQSSSALISEYSYSFEILILISIFLSNFKNMNSLTLTFSDNFLREIKLIFKHGFGIDLKNYKDLNISENKRIPGPQLHFLDLILDKKNMLNNNGISNLKSLNLEFNTLDYFSFRKILTLFDNAKKLKAIRFSLFTSEETYLSAGLNKLVREISNEINDNKKKGVHVIMNKHNETDKIIVHELLPYFDENMTLFFYILKNKTYLNELCLYGDSPSLISSNESYSLTLMKFILNIFIMLSLDNSSFVYVKLLFPYLKLDSRQFPGIIDFLKDINLYNTNKKLLHFHLQFQFYQINNIESLITKNLLTLTLGDLDLQSFISFIKVYSSKDFSRSSRLTKISIGLSSMIVSFNFVKPPLKKFFYTEIKNLECITLFSNLYIKHQSEFSHMMNYNWSKSYRIKLHKGCFPLDLYYYYLIKDDKLVSASIFENHRKVFKNPEKYHLIKTINSFLFQRERAELKQIVEA